MIYYALLNNVINQFFNLYYWHRDIWHKLCIQCKISTLDLFYGVNPTPPFLCGLQTLCSMLNLRTVSLLRPDSIRVCQKVFFPQLLVQKLVRCCFHSGWRVMTCDDWWAWRLTMWQSEGEVWRVTERITNSEPWMLSENIDTIYTTLSCFCNCGLQNPSLNYCVCSKYLQSKEKVAFL